MSYASPIRVFVKFKDEGVVFAGEDIECTITLKNVQPTKSGASQSVTPRTPGKGGHPFAQLKPIRIPSQTVQNRNIPVTQRPYSEVANKPGFGKGVVSSPSVVNSEEKQPSSSIPGGGFHLADTTPERRHGRSVSIKTLGSPQQQRRPSVKHRRSLSLQNTPVSRTGRRRPSWSGKNSYSASTPQLSGASTPSASNPQSPDRRRSDTRGTPTGSRPGLRSRRSSPVPLRHTNSFPQAHSQQIPESPDPPPPLFQIPPPKTIPLVSPPLSKIEHPERTSSHNKLLTIRTNDETPRNSFDVYSHSNRSDETLDSELPPPQSNSRLLRRPLHIARPSQLGQSSSSEGVVETLMMGYVQISGSFILDESLVNQSPFEEVKRKAVVGGQAGGGVVGIATPHGGGSYFGALSWGSIGSNIGSLGGLLGSGQPSSMNEMKGIADLKSIPLLSTPKSILFVDLKLAPGESKSFAYKFKMPRGLPPTHKGRAMKVSYNVTIATQRASKNNQQNIKQVEIPFRVFSGVNNMGESLGHDLFSPYIILKEQARITSLGSASRPPSPQLTTISDSIANNSSAADFQSYVNHLLTQPRKSSHYGLLSPTAEAESPAHQFTNSSTPSTRTLIDHAIHQCTLPNSIIYSPSRFNIARSSVPIATFMLSRPALKLGDLLTCVFDFTSAQIPCYALEAMLESSEKVDPSLAIRSPQSVERATRRVWARSTESCVWARRVTVSFQVPVGATPGFTTTGVGVDWCVRVEIIIAKSSERVGAHGANSGGSTSTRTSAESTRLQAGDVTSTTPAAIEGGGTSAGTTLLEVVNTDERGTTLSARQRLMCESFEVAIPIRVFGATAVGGAENGTGPDGLPV